MFFKSEVSNEKARKAVTYTGNRIFSDSTNYRYGLFDL